MKQLVPVALLSALIGGGVAFVIANMGDRDLERERERVDLLTGALSEFIAVNEKVGYILINKSAQAGRCIATTTPNMTAFSGQRLKWNFNIVDASCLANGERVQIRFKNTNTGNEPTEDARPISMAGKKHINAKLKDIFVENVTVNYEIWMVPASGEPYLMEDPELEIIATLRLKKFLDANPLPAPLEPAPAPTPAPSLNQSGNPTPPKR